ncbi:MAG: ATP phosphoribosyltransferase regulatory subunit [Acidimicrobiales bacterium]|nr:ATP phosphoribosyltransferase regulatory subunit [Acidimicrobiales bacterium]MCB9372952.1 ATP phosphoribosyltransferase regulatory subunit [Microthrixaceae bacterium]
MATTEPVSGAFDLAEESAVRAEALAEAARAHFRSAGYGPVKPPILERAAPFLDRLGEEIRSRMYIFTDPGGHEVCLRPELTIPTARLYADSVHRRGGPFRCYYVGSVFRFDWPRAGRYRQFTQVGAEFFNGTDAAAADVEVLALAQGLLGALGVADARVQVGDVSFFAALLADERLSAGWRTRLSRAAPDWAALERELAEDAQRHARPAAEPGSPDAPAAVDPGADSEIGALLDQTPAAQRDALLGRILTAVGPEHFGVRTPEEIARRLLSRAEARGPIEPAIATALTDLLAVDRPLADGLAEVRRIADAAGSASLAAVVDGWERRVGLLVERGVDAAAVRLRPRMGRGIHYYTGFVFEIHDGTGSPESQLCGGGRYDDLVESVGGTEPVPAVGFSLGLERVQLRLDEEAGT